MKRVQQRHDSETSSKRQRKQRVQRKEDTVTIQVRELADLVCNSLNTGNANAMKSVQFGIDHGVHLTTRSKSNTCVLQCIVDNGDSKLLEESLKASGEDISTLVHWTVAEKDWKTFQALLNSFDEFQVYKALKEIRDVDSLAWPFISSFAKMLTTNCYDKLAKTTKHPITPARDRFEKVEPCVSSMASKKKKGPALSSKTRKATRSLVGSFEALSQAEVGKQFDDTPVTIDESDLSAVHIDVGNVDDKQHARKTPTQTKPEEEEEGEIEEQREANFEEEEEEEGEEKAEYKDKESAEIVNVIGAQNPEPSLLSSQSSSRHSSLQELLEMGVDPALKKRKREQALLANKVAPIPGFEVDLIRNLTLQDQTLVSDFFAQNKTRNSQQIKQGGALVPVWKLAAEHWLCDEVVNAFLDLVAVSSATQRHSSTSGKTPRYIFVRSQFMQKVIETPVEETENPEHVEKLLEDFFKDTKGAAVSLRDDLDGFFAPVCFEGHWVLCKVVVYRNSLTKKATSCSVHVYNSYRRLSLAMEKVARKLCRQFLFRVWPERDDITDSRMVSFRYKMNEEMEQSNHNDCGVFVCVVASLLAQGKSWPDAVRVLKDRQQEFLTAKSQQKGELANLEGTMLDGFRRKMLATFLRYNHMNQK